MPTQAEMDVLAEFIDECCVVSPLARVKASDLYGAYRARSEQAGEKAITQKTLGLLLKERGFDKSRTGQARAWIGIGLRSENEADL